MKTNPAIELNTGDFIRYKYHGEWEYGVFNSEESVTIICAEHHIDQWRNGEPIQAVLEPCAAGLQDRVRRWKEKLRDGTEVTQCVWKGEKLEPRRKLLI